MGKYFGTDGVRGRANEGLTLDMSIKIGQYLGWYYGKEKHTKILIGKDTRLSGDMFELGLAAGATSMGAQVYLLGVCPTQAISYLVRKERFDCGIMVSASHNPYYDNGIKCFNHNGEKMEEETIALVEDYLDGKVEVFGETYEEVPYAHKNRIGCTVDYVAGRNRYVGYLISLGMYSFKGKKVGLDCANGSSWNIAKTVFDAVKAGDELAKEVAEEFGKYLGDGLAAIACVVNPEAIVIGGGVSKAGEVLIDYIKPHYEKNVFHGSRGVKFSLATLGNDAGIYGAAKLALG